MKHQELKGTVFLLLAAIIWGYALVAQKAGADNLGPLTFSAIRCTLGSLSLVPLFIFLDKKKTPEQKAAEDNGKTLLQGGLICGVIVLTCTLLQQIGIAHTSVGKSSFITALYIVFVPVAGIFLRRKVELRVWIAVVIAVIGFYLMCMTEGFSAINKGDLMMLMSAFCYAAHIYAVDYFADKIDSVKFSSMQYLFTGIVCSVLAFFLEDASLADVKAATIPLLYAGICSCGMGCTFQVIGQKYVSPAKTSLLLSSETIFAMTAGMIFFGEFFTVKEYVGCALIFSAIILSQITFSGKNTKNETKGFTKSENSL